MSHDGEYDILDCRSPNSRDVLEMGERNGKKKLACPISIPDSADIFTKCRAAEAAGQPIIE